MVAPTDQLTPFEDLLNDAIAAAIGQVKSGTVVVTTAVVGTPVSVPVSFGASFSGTPHVVATVQTTVPDNRAVGVSSISAAGFTCTAVSTAGSVGALTIHWIATTAAP